MTSSEDATTREAAPPPPVAGVIGAVAHEGVVPSVPPLAGLDELVRQDVRMRSPTDRAMSLLVEALRRRQAAEPGSLRFVTDVRVGFGRVAVLVTYRGLRGSLDLVERAPADTHPHLLAAGRGVAMRVHDAEVADAASADRVVDRLLREVGATAAQSAPVAAGPRRDMSR